MNNKKNPAEIADKHQQLIIFAMFLMSLKYVASATAKVVNNNVGYYLDILEIAFVVLAVGIIVPIIAWKFLKLTKEERKVYVDPDGYLFSIGKKAMSKSWAMTFIALAFIGPLSTKLLANFSTHFFIEAILAFMLGSFSIIFFILDRKSDVDDF